jgi:arabinose-5-phosphate isomerase
MTRPVDTPTADAPRTGGDTGDRDPRILAEGRRVLALEAEALRAVADRLGDDFVAACRLLVGASGRVIVAGIGKSGIIARKIAATMTSTGTPATFLHPIEGLHGDLGIVGPDDVAILISKSGETEELSGLVEYLLRVGVPMIALTGNVTSSLGRAATIALDCGVEEEACPMDLAPTTSTTVALGMGDALAVVALQMNGFRPEDFARYHPGGSLGRRLIAVEDAMVEDWPRIAPDRPMREAVVPIAEKRGTVVALDGDRLAGVVTAGDLTRLMERDPEGWPDVLVAEVMTRDPLVARVGDRGGAVLHRMEEKGVMALPVLDAQERVVGVVHLHDLMRSGGA